MNLISKVQFLGTSALVISSTGALVSYVTSLKNEISIFASSDLEKKVSTNVEIKDYTSFDNWLSNKETPDSHLSWL